MSRISNDYSIFFSSLSLFSSSFCLRSLNVIRSRHIRIPVVLIRHCPSLPRSTPSACRSSACHRANSNSLYTPIIVTLDVDRSDFGALLSVPASHFRPSSALCQSDSPAPLFLRFSLSFYPFRLSIPVFLRFAALSSNYHARAGI